MSGPLGADMARRLQKRVLCQARQAAGLMVMGLFPRYLPAMATADTSTGPTVDPVDWTVSSQSTGHVKRSDKILP